MWEGFLPLRWPGTYRIRSYLISKRSRIMTSIQTMCWSFLKHLLSTIHFCATVPIPWIQWHALQEVSFLRYLHHSKLDGIRHHIFCTKITWCDRIQPSDVKAQNVFLNSLIIHQVKTKKIKPYRRFGDMVLIMIGIDFDDFTSPFTPWEDISNTQGVFHRFSKHLEFRQKYSAACRIFNSVLGIWISWWNTVPRVWYITSRICWHRIQLLLKL